MFQLEKRHQLVLLILAAVILFGAGNKYARMQASEPLVSDALVGGVIENSSSGYNSGEDFAAKPNEMQDTQQIIVHVAGAVQKPGVYRLPADSRVVDAVNMAGPTENSALDYMNLAATLEDGRQVTVYSLEQIGRQQLPGSVPEVMNAEGAGFPATGFVVGGAAGGININTASMAQLEELPGIGPALAQRIIDYRTQNGSFLTIEDIQNVSGIGEKRFEELKSRIYVN